MLLPDGEDLNEWQDPSLHFKPVNIGDVVTHDVPLSKYRLAVNTVDFFNAITLLYGTLVEYCTDEACPMMCAGAKYEYRWADGVKVKKPIECSAPEYVCYLVEWIESQLDDDKARANSNTRCPLSPPPPL